MMKPLGDFSCLLSVLWIPYSDTVSWLTRDVSRQQKKPAQSFSLRDSLKTGIPLEEKIGYQ